MYGLQGITDARSILDKLFKTVFYEKFRETYVIWFANRPKDKISEEAIETFNALTYKGPGYNLSSLGSEICYRLRNAFCERSDNVNSSGSGDENNDDFNGATIDMFVLHDKNFDQELSTCWRNSVPLKQALDNYGPLKKYRKLIYDIE